MSVCGRNDLGLMGGTISGAFDSLSVNKSVFTIKQNTKQRPMTSKPLQKHFRNFQTLNNQSDLKAEAKKRIF